MELKDFKILSTLGEGGYGRVYFGINLKQTKNIKKNEAVAIKAISRKYAKSIKVEIDVSMQ